MKGVVAIRDFSFLSRMGMETVVCGDGEDVKTIAGIGGYGYESCGDGRGWVQVSATSSSLSLLITVKMKLQILHACAICHFPVPGDVRNSNNSR